MNMLSLRVFEKSTETCKFEIIFMWWAFSLLICYICQQTYDNVFSAHKQINPYLHSISEDIEIGFINQNEQVS